ncbi:VC0807 family protein [Fodinicola acaciae]|uniref:VC0807 family protein n=1 Tax=Fodinicola acaciae TaxID=2681555 RepID=UPI0013D520C2|nr:VC0807 family protein [Fodinicola acaciae]
MAAVVGEQRAQAPKLRSLLLSLVWDFGLALVTYYGLRALGADPFVALLAGTVVSGLRVAYVAFRSRTFDLFAAFLMTVFGVSLVLSFVTGSARFLLVRESFGTAAAGLFFLGSLFVGRPLIYYAARRMQLDGGKRFDGLWRDEASFRHIFRVMTVVWGVGLLFEAVVRIPLVFLLPIDVMAGVGGLMFVAVMVLLSVWNVWYVRRLQRGDAE